MSEKKKKSETIFRTFRTIVIKTGEEEGVIDILIPMSTASTDRHGESIDPKGWKKSLKEFKKRSILLSSHNYGSLQNQIGELNNLQITEEGLFASPKYYINQGNPEADWAHFLATKGMAAFSVGFIPIKWEDSDGKEGKPSRTYTEQELIEISQVTVPSNRDAIMGLQAKGIDDPIIKEVVEEILKGKEDTEFYDSHLLLPSKQRERLLDMAQGKNITFEFEGKLKEKLKDLPLETEEQQRANMDLVESIIEEALKGVEPDPIDPEKVKASIEKDSTDDKLDKMIKQLKFYPEIKYIITEDTDDLNGEEKDFKAMAERFCEKYLSYRKKFDDLEIKLADIELKAGAVLNTKNKANLKQAQALIQLVLDSAGTEEESLEEGDDETKDTKNDNTVITITDTKKEDPPKDEAIEKKTITIDDKILKEAINKALNYTLGIVDK